MRPGLRAAAVLLLLLPCCAGAVSGPSQPRSGERTPWLWLLPGGGQFLLGQRRAGLAYAAGTAGLVGWGVRAETVRGSGEINAPFLYAQQLYVTSLYSAYRDFKLRAGEPADPSSETELASAPFGWEQLKSPWVWGAAAVGAGLNLAIARTGSRRGEYRDVARLRYLGGSFNRDWGTAVYTAYWIPVSLGAGVAEEGLFRGILQAEWEERWGPRTGLAAASGLFGLAHLDRPKDPESWGQVAFAAAGGLYLGWRFQRTGRRLSQPVAAHFWFDAAAGLTLFFADPDNNPLGAKVRFAF